MTALLFVAHVAALLVLPIPIVGIINRVKARWAGRKGPRILQSGSDLLRLLRKVPVYSNVTTQVFRLGPLVLLASTLVSGMLAPLLGGWAPFSFPYDFVVFAYAWGLGRMAMTLSALDTGSSFEGMGASREATFGALAEPALFLAFGTLAGATGRASFAELLALGPHGPTRTLIVLGCLVTLFIVMQVESARVPVDDPTTHLELTMIHEVMILDHAGPELAALQYSAAMKLTVGAALVAALVNPLHAAGPWLAAAGNVALTAAVAVAVGTVESLVARFKLKAVPQYVFVAGASAFVALLLTAWWQGGGR
ncbi:MAG TPA: NADH-quinone oxidoreductase subunit H [Anaeromyxobacteraceae bacterium]|nr:NADH-quinone oxidoreductase subunit H [Anaeromyxobacteraceae bacterium]